MFLPKILLPKKKLEGALKQRKTTTKNGQDDQPEMKASRPDSQVFFSRAGYYGNVSVVL